MTDKIKVGINTILIVTGDYVDIYAEIKYKLESLGFIVHTPNTNFTLNQTFVIELKEPVS